MKKISKLLSLIILGIPLIATSCNAPEDYDVPYEYTYDRPFYSTPDDFMTIDGKFDEPQWSDCKWMQSTQFGVTIKITTYFSSKGIYLAAVAYDKAIRYNGRNNFMNSSGFELQIVKEDENVYNATARWNQHKMRDYLFEVDCQTCRSYRERNFNAAIDFKGEVNGETEYLAYEMFMGWDQMDYLPNELTEEGYPKNGVRLWSRYNVITSDGARYFSPFLMDYGRYNTYYNYGPKGIVNYCDNGVLGSAINGTTATDRWKMNEDKTVSCVSNQTNHIWFKKDAYGNELSRPVSFIADATVQVDPLSPGTNPYMGIMTIHDMNNMVTYGANLSSLVSKKASLIAFEGTDGNTWVGQSTWSTTIPSSLKSNKLSIRLIKIGGSYYYFYKDPELLNDSYHFVDMQYYDKNDSDVDVGLFANGMCTFLDYKIYDSTNDESFARGELSKSLYFVDTSSSSGGSVVVDKIAVAKGEKLQITCVPSKGYVLNDFSINGDDYFYDYINNKEDDYCITPTKDVAIKATFKKIPTEFCKSITYSVTDSDWKTVSGADYEIKSVSPLFYQAGETNSKGLITASLPIAGTFTIGDKVYVCDGQYTTSIEKKAYLGYEEAFTLTQDIEKEVTLQKTLWGQSVTLNNLGVSDAYGVMGYDSEGDYYYAKSGVRQYYTNQISRTGEYIAKVRVNTSRLGNATINPVVGLTLSSGSDVSLNIKSAWWETNNICIETSGKEVSVSGFRHNLSNNAPDSFIEITVARYNNTLYLYDYTGDLCVTIDSNGIHPVGNRNFVNKTSLTTVNDRIKTFFKNGKENAFGPLALDPANGKVDFHFETLKEENVEPFVTGGTITIDPQNQFTYTSEKEISAYTKGETVKLDVKANDSSKIIDKLTITSKDGVTTIDGTYDVAKETTHFEFAHTRGSVVITPASSQNLVTISGTVAGSDVDLSKTKLTLEGCATGTFSSLINASGAYSFKAPVGELEMMFINESKAAFVDKFDTTGGAIKNVTLNHAANMVGDATLNGIGIESKATLDITSVKGFVDGNPTNVKSSYYSREFGSAERREYFLALTNSVKVGDFTAENTMSAGGAYGYVGIGITDGGSLLICQLGTGDKKGTFSVKYGEYNNGGVFDVKQLVASGTQSAITGSSFTNVKLKAVKTDSDIKFYANDVLLCTIDNTMLDGEIEFLKQNKQYCVGYASTNLAGDVLNKITIS